MILDELCRQLGMNELLTPEEIALFQSKAQILQLPANKPLLEHGQCCSRIWFLVDGVIRMYNHTHHREFTLHLFTTSRFITDFLSLKTQQPAKFTIHTVIPSCVVMFDACDLYWFMEHSLNFERCGRKIFETLLYDETERLQDTLFLDATERYLKLWGSKPEYFTQIPQKYIASYLKISPETLSRIKKDALLTSGYKE